MEAAAQGEGVVLGRTMLVSADLAAGRLARPFSEALQSPSSFRLVYPSAAIRQPKVRAFRDWLLSEVGAAPRPLSVDPAGHSGEVLAGR